MKKLSTAILESMNESEKPQLDQWKIREIFAESGRMKAGEMMKYIKAKYPGQYDPKVARAEAKELAADMKGM